MKRVPAGLASVTQNAFNTTKRTSSLGPVRLFIATILKVYTDRYTCDVETADRALLTNIPLMSRGGLINNEIFGVFEPLLPDTSVIVASVGATGEQKFILGTLYPYINPHYQRDQVPVNSDNKAYTKKLLEGNLSLSYRRVFPSGTTMEVQEDGTLIIETPSGTVLKLDETSGSEHFEITDANGNVITSEPTKVVINNNFEVLQ